tara:strand:+ start:205 stop:372 length:168 start_codon:yes stop_codon:yes gene_type:complete
MAEKLNIYRPKKLDSSVKVDRLKPTGKVVKFNFKRSKKKPLKLRYTMKNSFEDLF